MGDNIKNLSEVLSDHLGSNKIITDTKISRLTAPGENFGSIMLRVDVTVVNTEDNSEEIEYMVGKTIPKNEIVRKIFNIQVTFKNEVAFYKTVVPTLRSFQKEFGHTKVIDSFADFYGARFNLDGNSGIIDENAVLVIENLHKSGFSNIDRIKGFDLETTRLILRDLAEFHAVPLALKLQKPEVFEKNVKAYCHEYIFQKDAENVFSDAMKDILCEDQKCASFIERISFLGQINKSPPREPFATLAHCDLWTNNTLQKFENGKAIANKFVDFQIFDYRSPAEDLFFFLWSSVTLDVLQKYIDDLIKYYHEHFISILYDLGCDIRPFGFEKLLEEIEIAAKYEFGHAVQFSTFVVFGNNSGSISDIFGQDKNDIIGKVSPDAKKRAHFMTLECLKRGWM